ncbi:hypothetical protein ACP70R_046984 [Stipagrostis hirtigluma subsp. patula]
MAQKIMEEEVDRSLFNVTNIGSNNNSSGQGQPSCPGAYLPAQYTSAHIPVAYPHLQQLHGYPPLDVGGYPPSYGASPYPQQSHGYPPPYQQSVDGYPTQVYPGSSAPHQAAVTSTGRHTRAWD